MGGGDGEEAVQKVKLRIQALDGNNRAENNWEKIKIIKKNLLPKETQIMQHT